MKRIWKPIAGYVGSYAVSNFGEVWSWLTEKHLKPGRSGAGGYLTVALRSGGVTKTHCVHRLVAEAFIPNLDSKPTVNHKRLPVSNNRVSNLEWATYSENHQHAYRVLGRVHAGGLKGPLNKKSKRVRCDDGRQFDSVRQACAAVGVSPCAIPQAISRNGKCAGLRWEFV